MLTIMRVVTGIAAVLALLVLFATFSTATGAPQEAAGTALALAIIIIPYCVTAMMQRSALIAAIARRDLDDGPSEAG